MRNRSLFFVVIISLSMFVFWGCPKKAEVSSTPETKEMAPVVQEAPKAEPVKEAPKAEPVAEPTERAAAVSAGLQQIYFDFDQSFIRNDAKAVMKANAEWLKANPKVKIKIEGNCDERGTREYNQALGQRRASAAKRYLIDMGIAGRRIAIISYGKEKQACPESTEGCWQKNRRDDLVVNE